MHVLLLLYTRHLHRTLPLTQNMTTVHVQFLTVKMLGTNSYKLYIMTGKPQKEQIMNGHNWLNVQISCQERQLVYCTNFKLYT